MHCYSYSMCLTASYGIVKPDVCTPTPEEGSDKSHGHITGVTLSADISPFDQ